MPEVGAPFPRDDERLERDAGAVHAHLFARAENQRTEIALVQLVGRHRVRHGLNEIVDRVLERHAVDLAGVEQSPHVLAGAEDRAAGRRFVAAHPLEGGGAELHRVREHVHGGVLPRDELAVAPDPIDRGQLIRHEVSVKRGVRTAS